MSLDARIARIEAQLAITQLVSRYAMAVDARDMESLADLFVNDVNCGRLGTGRAALISSFAGTRGFYRSMHQVCGQKIDLVDEDHATGQVYCRAEHEDGDRWVIMAISYFDTYERRAQGWRFVRRKLTHWYATDWQERPAGPDFNNWPGHPRKIEAPQVFPTFAKFWDGHEEEVAKHTRVPV